jgi:hypothetical protein
MTLIARLLKDKVPVYVGDLLLTQDSNARQTISIPAIPDINSKLPSGADWSVSVTRQKLNILGDRLAIAWACDYLQAYSLARKIRDAVAGGAIYHKEIFRVIEGVDGCDRDNVALIGTVLTPDANGIRLEHFSYAARKSLIGPTELVAAGTGADDLQRLFPQLIKALPTPTADFSSNLLWANQVGAAIAAALVGSETANAANILDRWGGGIEVATVVGKRFMKMGDVLHTAWKAKPRTSESEWEITLLPKLIKYDYFDDALVVQTLEGPLQWNTLLDGRDEPTQHCCYLSFPLLRGRREYNIEEIIRKMPDCSHTTLSCVVEIERPEVPTEYYVRVYRRQDRQSPFRVETQKDSWVIGVHDSLLKDLGAALTAPQSPFIKKTGS